MTQAGEPRDWPSDFMGEMWLLVVEESHLWEILLGVAENPDGIHRPWDPAECSNLLVRWLDAGLIELYRDREIPGWRGTPERWAEVGTPGWYHVLDRTEARELLSEPARWTQESNDGFILLSSTDEGEHSPLEAWIGDAR